MIGVNIILTILYVIGACSFDIELDMHVDAMFSVECQEPHSAFSTGNNRKQLSITLSVYFQMLN